jgi:hypothetical protein
MQKGWFAGIIHQSILMLSFASQCNLYMEKLHQKVVTSSHTAAAAAAAISSSYFLLLFSILWLTGIDRTSQHAYIYAVGMYQHCYLLLLLVIPTFTKILHIKCVQ